MRLEQTIPANPKSNVLPKDFEWVYVYVGKSTHKVGYIGRAKSPFRAAWRVTDHKHDNWYVSEKWLIGFAPCLNRWESESLETILINRYHPQYNKDKQNWGISMDDDPENDVFDVNRLNYVQEDLLTKEGIEESLKRRQEEIKSAMVKSGEWRVLG